MNEMSIGVALRIHFALGVKVVWHPRRKLLDDATSTVGRRYLFYHTEAVTSGYGDSVVGTTIIFHNFRLDGRAKNVKLEQMNSYFDGVVFGFIGLWPKTGVL